MHQIIINMINQGPEISIATISVKYNVPRTLEQLK